MDKKVLLIAFLLLTIYTKEMLARNLQLRARAYRDEHQRSKRAQCPMYIPCSATVCEGECDGHPLGCYQGLCIPLDVNPYKKKRSVDSPMEN